MMYSTVLSPRTSYSGTQYTVLRLQAWAGRDEERWGREGAARRVWGVRSEGAWQGMAASAQRSSPVVNNKPGQPVTCPAPLLPRFPARLHGEHPLGGVGTKHRGAAVWAQPAVHHSGGHVSHHLPRLLRLQGIADGRQQGGGAAAAGARAALRPARAACRCLRSGSPRLHEPQPHKHHPPIPTTWCAPPTALPTHHKGEVGVGAPRAAAQGGARPEPLHRLGPVVIECLGAGGCEGDARPAAAVGVFRWWLEGRRGGGQNGRWLERARLQAPCRLGSAATGYRRECGR